MEPMGGKQTDSRWVIITHSGKHFTPIHEPRNHRVVDIEIGPRTHASSSSAWCDTAHPAVLLQESPRSSSWDARRRVFHTPTRAVGGHSRIDVRTTSKPSAVDQWTVPTCGPPEAH